MQAVEHVLNAQNAKVKGGPVARHLAAIRSGDVTARNVIGIRKALAAFNRDRQGYSVGVTAPKVNLADVIAINEALRDCEPLVRGDLHASGVRVLTSPRYAKRWTDKQRAIIASVMDIRLVRFDMTAMGTYAPVYRATGESGSFLFRCIPWQSGGDGPESVQ